MSKQNWLVEAKLKCQLIPCINTIRNVLHQVTDDFMFDVVQHADTQQNSERKTKNILQKRNRIIKFEVFSVDKDQ